jgi:hypothetical protein
MRHPAAEAGSAAHFLLKTCVYLISTRFAAAGFIDPRKKPEMQFGSMMKQIAAIFGIVGATVAYTRGKAKNLCDYARLTSERRELIPVLRL